MNGTFSKFSGLAALLFPSLILYACSNATHDTQPGIDPADTPESRVGERLFRDPRFSQVFFANSGGNVNAAVSGDPVLSTLPHAGGAIQNPFAGQTIGCVSCHMVDDATRVPGGTVRAYDDFAERTLISVRTDGLFVTTRNTPPLVGASETRDVEEVFHFDGEFSTLEDLVVGGWTGRNFGWLAAESAQATAHGANLLRSDDGTGQLASLFDGTAYAVLLKGEDPLIPEAYRISAANRIDVSVASDSAALHAAARLVEVYLRGLQFAKDRDGNFSGSPYDEFLAANDLPRAPEAGETASAYADRLAWNVAQLVSPEWVEGGFDSHKHAYEFGPLELRGLRTFLARQTNPTPTSPGFHRVGNCVACHTPPNFTDFKFHNTGETQDEYDSIHGNGAFVSLTIPNPGAGARDLNQFRTPPSSGSPGVVDLGVWNVAFNPDFPTPQTKVQGILCAGLSSCVATDVVPLAIGAFKTSGLRDLGHTDPYFHTGRKRTVEEAVRFYINSSELARAGALRNAASELSTIELEQEDVAPLAAFLRALDEDYE